jgi:branched-chain amino acid transport system permease protein
LKGIIAVLIGGASNLPGAIAGGLILGLIESYCVALFGTPARDLFAYAALLIMLLWRPNGLFSRRRAPAPEVLTGSFVGQTRALALPRALLPIAAVLALLVPILGASPYLLQVLTNAWLSALMAISLTLIAGTVGMISLGQAGLLAIGAYVSALLALNGGVAVWLCIPIAAVATALLAVLFLAPTFRLRSHYFSIGTLGVGEMIGLIILNGGSYTHGAMGLVAIPPLSFLQHDLSGPRAAYWLTLVLLIVAAAVLSRLQQSFLGRTWRAIREDEVAAKSYGINLNRYKALAFGVAGLVAGLSGALSAHIYSYINYETFTSEISILALTMVILGGLGNLAGATLGAILLVVLPEVSRSAQSYRMLLYGLVLLLLTRFRPQGLLGRR